MKEKDVDDLLAREGEACLLESGSRALGSQAFLYTKFPGTALIAVLELLGLNPFSAL